MRRFLLGAAFVLLSIAAAVPRVLAQANVNEALETNYIYVDGLTGNDSNPGTMALPLKTIGAAVTRAKAIVGKTGSLITVNPGTYRESLNFMNAPANSLPVTVEAATNGTVTISGADVWTGWQPYGGNASIYTNTWPYDWGFCPMEVGDGAPYQTGLMMRREMVFMNGTPLTQVLSLSDMVYPDMFYVDETNGTIYVWPPSGIDIDTATVEVSTRDPLVTVGGWSSLVFRGITFQYANSCHNDRAVFVEGNSSNVLFDTDTFQWNNAKGINFQVPVSNVTVENSNGLHNGQVGFQDFQNFNVEYTSDTANYNNWRGSEGSYYSWGMGGFYFDQDHNATVSNLTALYQPSNGIHWDTNNTNSTATNITVAGNMLNGIFYEKDNGPMTLTDSIVADNMPNPEIVYFVGGGILFRNSENITMTNDNIFGNGNSQMYVTGQAGGILVTDWQTNQTYNLITSYLTLQQDLMESTTETAYGFDDPYLDGADWTSFATTLSSDQNTWWNPYTTIDFEVPTPSADTYADFQTWQSDTGQDQNSTFQEPIPDPAKKFVIPPPDYPDYWLAVDNPTLQVAADGTAVFNLATIPVGVFTSGVSLLIDGISEVPGLSGGLNTNYIATPGTAQVSLSSLPTIAPGYYPITVVGNSGGTGNATKAVQFNVIIPNSRIRIVPATLIFPATEDGFTSAPETAVMTNYGTAPITISSIVATGPFIESDNCNGVVAANGGSCTLTVTFSPSIAGVITGTLTVTDSDPTSPQVIALSGTGLAAPKVSLSAYVLLYGKVPVGQNSVMSSVLTNTGAGVLNISSVAISGTNLSDFMQTNTCGTEVQPGASCTFQVTFTPNVINLLLATLTIADNTNKGSQMILLNGSGTEPSAKFSPASLTFGTLSVGKTVTKDITLTNSGNGQLNISSISITGPGASAYSQTNTCGTYVLPYGNCDISVTFAPQSAGSFNADVTVEDNVPGSPQTVPLSGTEELPSIGLNPASLSFGNQKVGRKSSGQKITVTNTGVGPLDITSITVTGANPGDFSFTSGCNPVLGAGQSCTVTVFFDPVTQGSRSADLTFTTNAPNSPQNVSLSGDGT